MKAFARKQHLSLSLIAPRTARDVGSEFNAGTAKDSFQGWSHSAAVAAVKADADAAVFSDHEITMLSAEEFVRVDRATIREGRGHRFWPRHVLGSFLAAEVIKNSGVTHYVIHDPNITPVRR